MSGAAVAATLVLFAGQSNALGFGNVGPAPYAPTPRVQIWTDLNGNGAWDRADGFAMMVPGRNTGTRNNPRVWGPEVGFAKAWLAANPRGILYIGKVAKGSTALAANPAEDWSPKSRGEWFDTAAAVAAGMKSRLQRARLDAVFWMQGEEDATRPAWASAYATNLKGFLPAVRERWIGQAKGYIALGRIAAPAVPHARAIRVAQASVDRADPHTESFDTANFPLQQDRLHLSAEGQLALGRAFHQSWAR